MPAATDSGTPPSRGIDKLSDFNYSPATDLLCGFDPGACENGNLGFTLYAGQTIGAGSVCVKIENNTLKVTYTTASGWELTEAHLWIRNQTTDLPQNKPGNPVPGQFPFKFTVAPGQYPYQHDQEEATTDSYTVTGLSRTIYVVAHAICCHQFP
jgi:hypothetical protein